MSNSLFVALLALIASGFRTRAALQAEAIDSRQQGQGSAMMAAFCARMNERGTLSYLETDKFENVRFYRKFGFSVIAEAEILGVLNWFMSRPG